MKILVIGTLYEPDLGPSAPLYSMLCKGLVQRGHKVIVLTTVPHYPSGQVPTAFRGKWIWRSSEHGVDIIRVGLPSVNRAHLAKRLLQFFIYQLGATIAGIGIKYDVVLVANPSLSVWLPFFWFVVLRKKPAIYSVHDVYPDVGIKLGIFKNKFLISLVTAIERFCLKHAKLVRILSESFIPEMLNLGVPESKIRLIYDWVDTTLIVPLPRESNFSTEYGLNDRFVILYAGNIGLSQGLEHILTSAQFLSDQTDILFLFVGDGAGKDSLQIDASKRQLLNVQFIPFQPRERLPEVLACGDVSLVILRQGISTASLPSKTYSIMASGRPILASVDEESELFRLIKHAEAGLCIPPENPEKLVDAIRTLKQDKVLCKRLGDNGRNWVEQNHSPHYATDEYERLIFEAISLKKSN